MKRSDRIKINFSRNWNLPGKERLAAWLKASPQLKTTLNNGIIWLSNENIAIYTTADNYIEYAILSTGTYEDEIGKLINISLKPGFVALDIGGNIGLQSIRMSQSVGPNGKVYAFEPLNYLQKKFKKNIGLNHCNNVTLFPWALSDQEDTITVSIDEHTWNQGAFSLKNSNSGSTIQELIVKTGDTIEEIKNVDRLDLIKIDVEGFEYHVLRGLKNAIEKHRPRIIFEYDSNYWIKTSQSIKECCAFFSDLNYTLFQITDIGCAQILTTTDVTQGNLFCVPINNG
ncbi:FkbM family methyltransferase [Mucilaginibacter dorajii]|uniref:Methyltransferase FkbM domain-containing protein n=1 Tax=Mucilaginibacter dorajii TaxID=692994 RepID=A0ABP7Q264_9SPHI|nr:FkbM family methyltransferase [Mucilaginibacter dorajii]MCS3732780.1 FkbM family methyltransferase [Mucilaginibacter dorajii]